MDKNTKRMIAGKLYKGVTNERTEKSRKLMKEFNSYVGESSEVMYLIKDAVAQSGENFYIEAPFYFDHGWNISFGENFYANTGLIILDQCKVHIGNNVMIGPRVSLFCATHPIDAFVRSLYVESGKPITIKDDVWIGGHVVINPGVTVCENVIIASGSVVTKDLEADGIYGGNPAKLIRKITEKDKDYWLEQLTEFELDMGISIR